MGVGIVWVIGDWGRDARSVRWLFGGLLVFGIILGAIALFTSHYTIKSATFSGIIERLPELRDLPLVGSGFNVNEVAGAMSLVFGVAVAFALTQITSTSRLMRAISWASLLVLAFALLMGQSRMAIIGVLAVASVLAFALIPRKVPRWITLIVIAGFCIFEVGALSGLFVPPVVADTRYGRDEGSLLTRLYIWEAGVNVIIDHPLTGVGINQFRSRAVRALYPVQGYEDSVLPHAHNLILQTGADLGVPGIIVYLGLTVTLGVMLWRVWKQGEGWNRTAAAAIAAGISAYLIFSLADAIPLFDRFIFLYWMLVAAGTALYVQNRPSIT